MATRNLNQQSLVFQPIFNALVPSEGPKGVPISMDFNAFAEYDLDYQNQQSRGFVEMIQTIWVDTSQCGAVTIVISVSGQVLTIPAKSNGYISVLVPNPPKMTFTGTAGAGTGIFKCILLNVPMSNILYTTP